jgi:hypothetical protein
MLHHVDDVWVRKRKRVSERSRREARSCTWPSMVFYERGQNRPNFISSLDTLASSSPLPLLEGQKLFWKRRVRCVDCVEEIKEVYL